MHRLSNQSDDYDDREVVLFDQPEAPILFLTSASTDISALSEVLSQDINSSWDSRLKAISINDLTHPAVIDHYLARTAKSAQLILVRLLGGKTYWAYGLEQLKIWQKEGLNRNIIILSGSSENTEELHNISSFDTKVVDHLARLFNIGGHINIQTALNVIYDILLNKKIILEKYNIKSFDKVTKWDWKNESGNKILIVHYDALLKSNDLDLPTQLNKAFRNSGISPKTIFVKTLKDIDTQKILTDICTKEEVEAIITTTAFSSSSNTFLEFENTVWDKINVPIFQSLISTESKQKWKDSSLGLSPTDLTLQVVMPEMDGRITTRPCAFKEKIKIDSKLSTSIKLLQADKNLAEWIAKHVFNWIKLRNLPNDKKRVTIILANYPIKNSRIANGVGLDTPASLYNIINYLKDNNYNVGDNLFPQSSKELLNLILSSRTNDPESNYKLPLDYLSLKDYEKWWDKVPLEAKQKVENRWSRPSNAIDLENKGFAIHGIKLGNIAILIQPSRGYDPDSIKDLHSPDLPPPHRYLAQYSWIEQKFNSQAIIHLGKHGSLEWLPGKGIGLSQHCFPHVALPALPNIYPFIVNDPGEGSQAKRRSQAVIIDHLTPPLGRAESYGCSREIEILLDEYYEAKLVNSERVAILKAKLKEKIISQSFPSICNLDILNSSDEEFDNILEKTDSYLCELKDSQIRIGLHIFGSIPQPNDLIQLVLSIARAPQYNVKGITQHIATLLSFELDPWSSNEGDKPSENDKLLYYKITKKKARRIGEILDYLDSQASIILYSLINTNFNLSSKDLILKLNKKLHSLVIDSYKDYFALHLKENIINKIYLSSAREKQSIVKALKGQRINSGPSGSPTRGKLETLPTGKNFYSIDIRSLPTEASWDLGKRSANQIIELYNLEKGEELKHLAISIWATSTMRNGGEDVSQILALMGIQPVWDYSTKRLIDLDVIPINILGRPRVEVITRISGMFRDSFPQLVQLIYQAQQKVSQLKEPINLNPYIDKGQDVPRIFGSAPGSYGAGLQEILNNSNWDQKKELVDSYLNWSKWSYKNSNEPIENIKSIKESLKEVQVVLQNQDNKEHDILDSDDYYQFHGGLAASVEHISGKKPTILLGDHSRHSRPRINNLEHELDKVVRSRLLNPKWIEGMKSHGYKGAFEIGASIDYLFGYDATTNLVSNWCYEEVYKTFIDELNNRNFIATENPWVLRDIGQRLLEAINRELWSNPDKLYIENLKKVINNTDLIIEKYENKD